MEKFVIIVCQKAVSFIAALQGSSSLIFLCCLVALDCACGNCASKEKSREI
jgi:hypothetical protein